MVSVDNVHDDEDCTKDFVGQLVQVERQTRSIELSSIQHEEQCQQ